MNNENRIFNLEEMKDKLKRGSIWYIDLGERNGSIQAGIRPCIVVSNQKNNEHSPVLSVVSMTAKVKKGLPTHIHLCSRVTRLRLESTVLCEQVMTVNKSDIKGYVSQLSDKYIDLVNLGLKRQLALENEYFKTEVKEEEEINKVQQENFSFEYAQEIISTIEESINIYDRLKSNLALNMIKQHVSLLINYCTKFNKACELYKRRYEKYLSIKTNEIKLDLILAK